MTKRTTSKTAKPGTGRGAAARRAASRRKQTRRALVAAGLAVVIAVALLAFRGSSPGSAVTTPTAFSLPALNGAGQVALASYRGRPTVVNFFASWCSACDRELPGFKAEADALKGKVTFIGVDSLETGDKNFMPNRHHLVGAFTALAQDVSGANGSGLHDALGGGNSMPLTAFYDANGTLLDVQRTALEPQVLHDKLAELYHL
ncbi:MAG: hypothetical protein NVS3B26_24820 [Mycobacteriales bacterium]